ncbi:MAG: flagellar motor switch protein FliN [Ignavibacteria bacterium]|jgi:flagellar motor switch protein FliN/FliY|nr:flagellar motor switch protein FliN [Ignavibacteria bacterium]MCU7503751.1 flagellar motor switch protein FliN [Ignavibacteria bacterium]MCU7517235.1 flagellar motor switch protein FliN [Ignavibacteria bacterium]
MSADDILGDFEQISGDQITGGVADFPEFDESNNRSPVQNDKLEFLKDLQLSVYIELGRTQMLIKDILELERGYVIELDKLASEPVDIFVNNKKIAEGEVVVIDKHFGIRITNLVDSNDRLKGLS